MNILYWLLFILFMIFSFPGTGSGTSTITGWRVYGSFAAWLVLTILLALIGIKVFPFPWGS